MTAWALQALLASTVLMAAVLALRGGVARRFGPRAAYLLWAVPALRMVAPPMPGWLEAWPRQAGFSDLAAAFQQQAAAYVPWTAAVLAVWLAGALLWFAWQMLIYRRFLRAALGSATAVSVTGGIETLTSAAVSGPVAAGILQPRIFLPADFAMRYAPGEARLALLHEDTHHRRRDIAANLCASMMLALHWWNPMAYLAYRAFRTDQELACDATVLAGIGAAGRHAYGSAMLKSVMGRVPVMACALSQKDELKLRLRFMARAPAPRGRRICGAAAAAIAVVAGLLATAWRQPDVAATGSAASFTDLGPVSGRMRRVAQTAHPSSPHLEFRVAADAGRHILSLRVCSGVPARASNPFLAPAPDGRCCVRAVSVRRLPISWLMGRPFYDL